MKSAKVSRQTPPAALLQPCAPEALQRDIQQIQLAIARRAHELFETRGREHGHDWEDWFQAETELLRPVSIAISESADGISIRANVLGLSKKELKVGVEPKRVVILGRKTIVTQEAPPSDFHPDQILRVIELTDEVDPKGAVVELQTGVLRFELPKVKKTEAKAAVA